MNESTGVNERPKLCSSTHMCALSQFLLHIFLLSPTELIWSQVIE
jgi:hypothetical protein